MGCFLRERSITCVGSKPPKDNLTSRQHKAIRDLRRDKEIVVLPADKGNVTVVMDQSDYTVKMEALLEDSAYRRLKYDPTTKVEARITSALKELEQKGHLSTKQRLFLTQIYGLPKVHKEGTPCDQSCLPSALPHTNWPGSLSES